MSLTPLMGLDLPTVGVGGTPGPEYASKLIAAFQRVDSHDHSENNGARIGVAGLEIDGDLGFNGNNLQGLRSVRVNDQSAALAGANDLRCLYAVNGELFYNDGAGNDVQLTSGGGINAASVGGIGGDYATSAASVSYSDTTKIFTFTQSSGVTAKLSGADVIIREAVASAQPITIKSPASLAGAYSLTLFAALPADDLASNLVTLTAAGVFATSQSPTLVTPQIRDTSKDHSYIFAVGELVANRTITLPVLTGNDVFVFEAHTQTLTNKTINGAALAGTLSGNPLFSGQVTIDSLRLRDSDDSHVYIFSPGNIAADRTIGIPALAGNDVLVLEALAQTLTNKTINGAALAGTLTGNPVFSGIPDFSNAGGLKTDVVAEHTAAAGITLDGVLLKDSAVTASAGVVAPNMCPIGTVVAVMGTFAETANGGAYDESGIISGISDWWVECDGTEITDGPLSGLFTPDLTDRFLMSAAAGGTLGGSNSINPQDVLAATGNYTPAATLGNPTTTRNVAASVHDHDVDAGNTGPASTGTAHVHSSGTLTTGNPSNTNEVPDTDHKHNVTGTGVARTAWFKSSADVRPAYMTARCFMLTRHS